MLVGGVDFHFSAIHRLDGMFDALILISAPSIDTWLIFPIIPDLFFDLYLFVVCTGTSARFNAMYTS